MKALVLAGLFGAFPGGSADPKLLAEAKAAGFGLVVTGAYESQLDAARAAGLKAVVALWVNPDDAKSPERWPAALAEAKEKVSAFKDHPALYAWYPVDEPDGDAFPKGRLSELREALRAIDPKTPWVTVFDKPRRWSGYFEHFDIVAVDPYLRRRRPLGGYDGVEVVTDWLKAARRDLRPGQKLWAVLGAFAERPKDPAEQPGYRKPTPAEFSDMTRRALAEGVDGVFVYTFAHEESERYGAWNLAQDDPALWKAVKAAAGGLPKGGQ